MTEKTAMQQMIDFITSEEYPHLYTAVKDEWFKTKKEKEKQKIENINDLKNELFKKNINFCDNPTSNDNVFTLTFSINKNNVNNEFIVSYENDGNIKTIILMGNNGNLKKSNIKKIYSTH